VSASETRRDVLRAGTATLAGALVAGCLGGSPGLGTGESLVRVRVGIEANGGAFGFSPAAVRVSTGTTVVWEWTGAGGAHDVHATDGSFGSTLTAETGHTFRTEFPRRGTFGYVCGPHRGLGMKGAIVVE
jgi:halocyanin-like protein